MATKTLQENVNQAINDLCEIREALIKKGVECPSGTPTCEYGEKIEQIQSGGDTTDFKGVIERTATNPKLPNDLTEIGGYAFQYYRKLVLPELPSGLTGIGGYAFCECINLALTELPAGITSIGYCTFGRCTGLTTITFKGTPSSIDSGAFSSCTNLTTIRVPWAEGEVANAPWGATNATLVYSYTES